MVLRVVLVQRKVAIVGRIQAVLALVGAIIFPMEQAACETLVSYEMVSYMNSYMNSYTNAYI